MKTLTATETAAFQAKLGVEPDGKWGRDTQAAFEKWAGISPVPVPSAPEFQDNPVQKPAEFDERSERMLATLLPGVRDAFRKLLRLAQARAADFGCDCRIISGNRTYGEQDLLYAQGRTKPGNRVTNAKGGFSNHNFGIAVDLGIFAGGQYLDEAEPARATRVHSAIAELVKLSGLPLDWGGDWKSFRDIPHWEFRTGLTMAQKRDRVASGKPLA